MHADVYTAFLTNKIKVFATQKGVKPFKIAGRHIRKAYPFLLSSAMILSGCSQQKTNTLETSEGFPALPTVTTSANAALSDSQKDAAVKDWDEATQEASNSIEWDKIYQEVIQTYGLDTLKTKEPFSKQEILDLMNSPNPPPLRDTDYNHRFEDQDNFWEIVRNGMHIINTTIQNSEELDKNLKQEYKITAFKMLSQMNKYKGSDHEVDVTDYNNEKAALFFERVIDVTMRKDKYEDALKDYPGYSTERTEFLGRYYKDFERLIEVVEDNPNIKKFVNALYDNDDRYFFTPKEIIKANAISRKVFEEWKKEQHITDKNLYILAKYAPDDSLLNKMSYCFLEGYDCDARIIIEQDGKLNYGKVAPVWSILVHELQHLAQKEAASRKEEVAANSYLAELGPTLSSLSRDDQIFKKMYDIAPDAVVDYGATVDINQQKIPMGEIAVWWWNLEQKYKSRSVDDLLCKPEAIKQLNEWSSEKAQSKTNYNFMMIQVDRIR